MITIEEAILTQTDVTAIELRQAQLEYPICGAVEALSRKLGGDRSGKFITTLCEKFNIPLLSNPSPEVDMNIFQAGGERLLWLIIAYRAIPIAYHTEGSERVVQLAMADPFDQRARLAFERFCGAAVSPILSREVILAGVVDKVFGKSLYVPSSRIKMSSFIAQRHGGNEDVSTALLHLLKTASQNAARTIELELDREFTRAIFQLPFDRIDTLELKIRPEVLASAIVERGQIHKRDEKNFYGSTQVELDSSLMTCSIEYHERHLNRAGNNGRGLVLSNLTSEPLEDVNFWGQLPEEQASSLRTSLGDNSGIYLAVVQKSEQVLRVVAALGQVCPTLGKAYAVGALKQGGELLERANLSPILVGVQGDDLVSVLNMLSTVPLAVKKLIKGVITYSEVPMSCPFCGQRCRVDSDTTDSIPSQLSLSQSDAIYPRGCGYCDQKGYLGTQGLVNYVDWAGALSQAVDSGANPQNIKQALSQDRAKDFLEQALDAVVEAKTTVEALAREVLGRQDVDAKRTLSVGKVLIGASGEAIGIGGDKSAKVGGDMPTASMIGHHSVVLDMGFDLMAAREAVKAEGESAFGPGKLESADEEDPIPLSLEDDLD